MQNDKKPRYTLKKQVSPLAPSKKGKASIPRLESNEDDDLYDPYSDYHDGNLNAPSYEEDPWR